MTIAIREYRPTDWAAVCRVHDAARPLEVQGFMPRECAKPMEQDAEEDRFFDSQTFVACVESAAGAVVGFVSIQPPELTCAMSILPCIATVLVED